MSKYFVCSAIGDDLNKVLINLNEQLERAIENGYFPCSSLTVLADGNYITVMQSTMRGDVIKELYKGDEESIYKYELSGYKPKGKNNGKSFRYLYKNIEDAKSVMEEYHLKGYINLNLTMI